MALSFEKDVFIPVWDERLKAKAIQFWTDRGFCFDPAQENRLTARRGSMWGNLVSFNMGKLKSNLTLTVLDSRLHCRLEVNTFMQQITEYNARWWPMELDTFETCMLADDPQTDKWNTYHAVAKKAAFRWLGGAAAFGLVGTLLKIAGDKITPTDKQKLDLD